MMMKKSLSLSSLLPTVWTLLVAVIGRHVTSASLYDNSQYVKRIDKYSTFEKEVLQDDGVWMIQFYSPTCPHCKNLVSNYEQVAEISRGVFHIAAVDMSTAAGQRIGATYKVDSYPTIYMYGHDKSNPKQYTGQRDAQNLLQAIMDTSLETLRFRAGGQQQQQSSSSSSSGGSSNQPSRVVQLTSANFQKEVLDNPLVSAVAFTAPWCGHCKRLEPDWEEAARKVHGEGAFLGWVDATAERELASIYGVQGFPTIKLFPGGQGKTHASAMDYNGDRSVSAIVSAVLNEVERTGVPKEIPELTSFDILQENCAGQNHICVLAALPHILDSGADGRNKYRDLIASVAKTFRGSAFSFLWFEGSSQPQLEDSLELTFGFPALVAFSMDREAYAVLRGSFNEKSITSFLHGVTSGRQRTVKLSKMPTVATVDPWDGLDGAPIEDEIPLSEIMGWDDDDDDDNNVEEEKNGDEL